MGDVGEHRGEGERTHVGRVHEAKAIKRDGGQKAGERGQLGKRPWRAPGSADLEENVPAGKRGTYEAGEREGRSKDGAHAREENEEMPRGKAPGH